VTTPSWASFDAYLFDLDGTLVDTAPDINAALNHSLRQAGLNPVDQALTRHWVGHGSRVLIAQALQHHHVSEIEIDTLLEPFLTYYRANLSTDSVIYPGVTDTLMTLRNRGARLAVVTNKLTALSVPLLEGIGLAPLFDLIVCGDTTTAPKPDPAPVQFCLDHFDVAAGATLFVGDSETDVNAARAAGVAVVCVRDGYNHGVDVTTLPVSGVIDNFSELLA
jgi:phosphoglycolate phosphatase